MVFISYKTGEPYTGDFPAEITYYFREERGDRAVYLENVVSKGEHGYEEQLERWMFREGYVPEKSEEGGAGSGNFGHEGVPGLHGGSAQGSSMPAEKQASYKAFAERIGYRGEVKFIGSPKGSGLMGTYSPEEGVVITDEAWRKGLVKSAISHEVGHAKYDEVMTAAANEEPAARAFDDYVRVNQGAMYEEGKGIGWSDYARTFWEECEPDDIGRAMDETFAELTRIELAVGMDRLGETVGTDSTILGAYKELGEAYANLNP